MSKNITIQEGGVAKSLSGIKKIKTSKQGSGTVLWIPEDEVTLKTKSVNKNGTYKAKDDGAYGYSQFTVTGIGQAQGTNPSTGNDAVAEVDPQTGEITIRDVPSSIDITTPPTKLTYTDGETIDFTGMVVKLKLKNGNIYTDSSHPDGIIPHSELTFPVTVAHYEPSNENSNEGGTSGGGSGSFSEGGEEFSGSTGNY